MISLRVDEQGKTHLHQQRYQPFRFFQEKAMGKEDGIFEETEALPLGYELKISIKLERA